MMQCRKCPEGTQQFRTMSTLRAHQWKVHRADYANIGRRSKSTAVVLAGTAQPLQPLTGSMTVRELITKLEGQQKFLAEHIAFLKGWL